MKINSEKLNLIPAVSWKTVRFIKCQLDFISLICLDFCPEQAFFQLYHGENK